jgi:hypothetical protein
MARKTKAEMELLAENARYMQEAEAEASYLPRLMAALAKAIEEYFELTVEDNLFVVTDRASDTRTVFAMSPTYTREAWELDSLESYLAEKEKARLVSEARYLAKQAALNKLSAYERELLDL